MPKSILVVDDDALIRRSLAVSLAQAGYQVQTAASGENALEIVRAKSPDLVLLDISMPGMDGLEALRTLRAHAQNLPVIFLTARRRELDEVVGLELGADDYVTKPFDLDVLLAHIKAVLRRTAPVVRSPATTPLVVGDLRIDASTRVVQVGERLLDLPPKEFELLFVLAQNAERVLPLDELLKQVWGVDWVGESQTLYVHIRWLREKIEEEPAHPRRLITVRGAGYKLVAAN